MSYASVYQHNNAPIITTDTTDTVTTMGSLDPYENTFWGESGSGYGGPLSVHRCPLRPNPRLPNAQGPPTRTNVYGYSMPMMETVVGNMYSQTPSFLETRGYPVSEMDAQSKNGPFDAYKYHAVLNTNTTRKSQENVVCASRRNINTWNKTHQPACQNVKYGDQYKMLYSCTS